MKPIARSEVAGEEGEEGEEEERLSLSSIAIAIAAFAFAALVDSTNISICASRSARFRRWPADIIPRPPALVTSDARSPPDTPAIGAETNGRRIPIASVKGVFHALLRSTSSAALAVVVVVVDMIITVSLILALEIILWER